MADPNWHDEFKPQNAIKALNKNLGTIYKCSEEERKLQAYIRQHIFAQLGVTSLPLQVAGEEADKELSDTARDLVDTFFKEGKNNELGWCLRDVPEGERQLHKLIVQLLLLPSLGQWQDDWLQDLKRAADENGPIEVGVTWEPPQRVDTDGGNDGWKDERVAEDAAHQADIEKAVQASLETYEEDHKAAVARLEKQRAQQRVEEREKKKRDAAFNLTAEDMIPSDDELSDFNDDEEDAVYDEQGAGNRGVSEHESDAEGGVGLDDGASSDDVVSEDEYMYESSVCGGDEQAAMRATTDDDVKAARCRAEAEAAQNGFAFEMDTAMNGIEALGLSEQDAEASVAGGDATSASDLSDGNDTGSFTTAREEAPDEGGRDQHGCVMSGCEALGFKDYEALQFHMQAHFRDE